MSYPSPVQDKRSPPLLLTQVHLPHRRLEPASSTWNSTASRW